uniref:Uncharacterized protein n=1 Tax=Anguilla anguilla TaxID=7936 RepID=A0A0E9SYW1_ANGAN
MFSVSVVTC